MSTLTTSKPLSAVSGMPARDLRFCEGTIDQRWYMAGDPVSSSFLSALSATFPLGEKFFIDSVRRFGGKVHGRLAEDIRAFVVREAFHTREHLAFNKLVEDTGYAITAMPGIVMIRRSSNARPSGSWKALNLKRSHGASIPTERQWAGQSCPLPQAF